jgi:multidrug resistance protein MdtO
LWFAGAEMAAVAQPFPASKYKLAWLWEWLRDELSPYPGRALLVARMVTAATLVMIISMTFRLPYGAYAALYALNLSHDSLEGTRSAVKSIIIGFALAGAYLLTGSMLVIGDPLLRFFWITGTMFLIFYGISATSNSAVWSRFGYMAVITITLWDRQITAQAKVYGVLWAIWMLTMASVIALLLEIAYEALRRGDDLLDPLIDRLVCVEKLLTFYANGRPVDAATQSGITRYATLGTSRLRRLLSPSNESAQYAQEMGAVVALTGRLMDLAASLPQLILEVPSTERNRVGMVATRVAQIRDGLTSGSVPPATSSDDAIETWSGLPLMGEIEKTVLLICEVLSGSSSLQIPALNAQDTVSRPTAIIHGSLLDPEHLKFGMKGCLAASLCYVTYTALAWPELSTSLTTCYLTALTTVGASHQKQVLRFAGALIGGFVIGMGAQIFILPYIDSIAEFTALFIVVTCAAAWIVTSSPRLSYLGVQVAFAFFLINLQEFKIQVSLSVARDRVVGILLGLTVMWLVFDQLWSTPAAVAMKKAFAGNLRLLAQLAREPVSKDLPTAIERSYTLRETINAEFDRVRSLADGILFELGPDRRSNLELRDRIRRWQPQMRTLFVMRVALLKYRLRLPGFELPEAVLLQQEAYDEQSAQMLEHIAARIELIAPPAENRAGDSRELLIRIAESIETEGSQVPPSHAQSFIALLRGIDGLTVSLASELCDVRW